MYFRKTGKNIFLLFFLFSVSICTDAQNFLVSFNSDKATVVDPVGSDTIISPGTEMFWKAQPNYKNPIINPPVITTKTYNDGFDVKYSFTNSKAYTASIGEFYIDGIRFDSVITARFGNYLSPSGNADTITPLTKSKIGEPYPGSLYSPVQVISNGKYTLGISIQYDVLNYKHQVSPCFKTDFGIGHKGYWGIRVKLNSYDTYSDVGDMKSGEKREYVVTVRIIRNNDSCKHWLNTLEPYKKYFQRSYGSVTYQRDPNPVCGTMPFQTPSTSSINQYGFVSTTKFKNPVTDGFKSLSDFLRDTINVNKHFKRSMLWAPTGVYVKNKQLNFPFKFTSHWLEGDTNNYSCSYGHKMGDAFTYLPTVSSSNLKLGLWWGNADVIMSCWDDTTGVHQMNFNNAQDSLTALREIFLADSAGVREIGLDAFSSTGIWKTYHWLKMLRQRFPNIKFISEQGGSDIMHTLVPLYYYSYRMKTSHYLADFLLPGNETWAQIDNSQHSTAYWKREFDRLNNLGYVSLDIACGTLDKPYLAKQGWTLFNPGPDLGADIYFQHADTTTLHATHAGSVSYLWSTGSTTSTININNTQPGTYWVVTTNASGCTQTDTIIVSSSVYVNELNREINVNIFPNPALTDHSFIVQFSSEINTLNNISLIDILGKAQLKISGVQLNNNTIEIPLIGISPGMYFVKIDTGENSCSKKIIVR